jgi:hypothetical protein
MAIVVDPDSLDRKQVIFGTEPRKLSLWPCLALVHASATQSTGETTAASTTFEDQTNGDFITWGVAEDDILCIFTGADQRHYRVDTITDLDTLSVKTDSDFTTFSATATSLVYEIRDPTGGSIADGVTEQALYSFSKEEWRVDSETYGSDDLRRHPFIYEPITPEQFEIGGGLPHDDWMYANDYTRNKVRFGGWRVVDSSSVNQYDYAGFVSLGPMQSTSKPYFQRTSATTAPTSFAFSGPVNEAALIWDNGGPDYTTYFKAFLRTKGYSYASYDLLTEQSLTALTYKVYSFPLSEATDAAIVDADSDMGRTSPYVTAATSKSLGGSQNDGVTVAGSAGTFTSATATWQTSNVEPGDVLQITSGTQQGYYYIISVDSETNITVSLADQGDWTAESSLTFVVTSRDIILKRTDGVLADVDGSTGTLTSATGGFSGTVAANDMVVIEEAASGHRGVYKVVSQDSDTQLTLNTQDNTFTSVGSIDFRVCEPSMWLQYKWETIATDVNVGTDADFADADPDTITRQAGSWISDGVEVGDVVYVYNANTAANNGYYTVQTVAALVLTLVPSDSLTTDVDDTSAQFDILRGFRRQVGNYTYSFRWRLLSNGGTAAQCFQFEQQQIRLPSDIDWGPGTARGDITDQLLTFATPTGQGQDMIIDDIASDDTNNVTYIDATGVERSFNFVSAGKILFNANLKADTDGIYHMYFLNDDAGDDNGYDYGTPNAITVQDSGSSDISGTTFGLDDVDWDYDYDNNTQRGAGSAGTNAPVVIIAIGLDTAQFFRFDGTITRAKGLNFSLVSALERNYSNP